MLCDDISPFRGLHFRCYVLGQLLGACIAAAAERIVGLIQETTQKGGTGVSGGVGVSGRIGVSGVGWTSRRV